MQQTYRFAHSAGNVACTLPSGQHIVVPLIAGILKHPLPDKLPELLQHPDVVRKYTLEALRFLLS